MQFYIKIYCLHIGYDFIALLLLLALNFKCPSQNIVTSFNPIVVNQHHNFGEGQITVIKEDWYGFIWVATTDGLYRFDGTESIRYDRSGSNASIINSFVTSLLIDEEQQKIWVGTRGGLTGLHPILGNAQHFRFNYLDSTSIADNHIMDLYKGPSNNIWISCFGRGLSKFDPIMGTFENYYFENPAPHRAKIQNPSVNKTFFNNIYKITGSPNDSKHLYLGTGGGLVRYNIEANKFNQISTEASNYSFDDTYLDKSVSDIIVLEHSIFFIHRGELIKYDLIGKKATNISSKNRNELNIVKHIDEHSSNQINANGYDYNAFINSESLSISLENRQSGQKWKNTQFLLEDSRGHKWYSSSIGLLLEPNNPYHPQVYSIPKSKGSTISTHVKHPGDTVVALTDDHKSYHLFSYSTKKWTTGKILFRDKSIKIKSWQDIIHEKGSFFLVLSQKYLGRLDIKTGNFETIPLLINSDNLSFLRLLKDTKGNLWISTPFNGLYKANLSSGKYSHFKNEFSTPFHESLYSWIYDLFEDSVGRIWVRLSKSHAVLTPEKAKFDVYSHEQFAENTFRYVSNFTEDGNGNIWIGSLDEGIGMINSNQIEQGIINRIDKSDGLLHNSNYQLQFGNDDDLWNLNHGGLSLLNLKNFKVTNRTWDQGISKSISFEIFENGDIGLILRDGGISVVPKSYFEQDSNSPILFFKEVFLNDSLIYTGIPGIEDTLSFKGTQSNLRFSTSGIGFNHPTEFAYMLQGVDKTEVYSSNGQSPIYSNLTPSNYMFKVRSRTLNGVWSKPHFLYLVIKPKWWQTIWFKISLLLTFGTILYFLYLNRLNEIRKKADYQQQIRNLEMQTLRAQMNPHFLYNSLNSIQNFIIKNKTKEAVSYLDKFSRLVRLILQNSRSKRIPLCDELDAIKHYLEIESLRFKNAFDYRISVSTSINVHDIEIPPMLIQPFIENAILHGIRHKQEKGHIEINVNLIDELLECVIKDNGIGRKASIRINDSNVSNKKSISTAITLDRIQVLNDEFGGVASMTITDLEDEDGNALGTEVRILVPIF